MRGWSGRTSKCSSRWPKNCSSHAPHSAYAPLRLPVAEPDLTAGPVLLSEAPLLAVPTDHHLAQRTHVTPADLTERTFLFAQDLPDYWIEHHLPIPQSAARITLLPGFQE